MSSMAVIVNAGAGAGYEPGWQATLVQRFADHGLQAEVTLAVDANHMLESARAALAAGARVVVAGGGDGTINAVASVVLDSGAVFGVLPMGTLNHFARDLGLPPQLDAAIATLAAGHVTRIDVGEVNGRIFLNNSSLGLYPDIVRDRQRQQRRLGRGKWTAFGWATLAALRRFPFLSVRLAVGDADHARRTPFVFIGNNEYQMEGFNIGERARINGGMLSVYVAQRPTRFGLLKLALRALFGRLRQAREFDVFQAREMTIETRHRRLRVATDGEVTVMAPPLRYRIRPAALSVIVPRPQEE
ncbi:sphingosine kinase [Pseudoduganella sp. DS3]|uniref:Sphingosine kinase n=1 Tax=Pseudoduganella guangdongensis TaxID=2692179 RepID=A0A6N9HEM9_9BURK|nr:diacylglycerol kinase family protein [Pseudoduganella guangdongensis]MYN02028.1 sphingosine kinase [Pseudoduganella guangdongensis]